MHRFLFATLWTPNLRTASVYDVSPGILVRKTPVLVRDTPECLGAFDEHRCFATLHDARAAPEPRDAAPRYDTRGRTAAARASTID